jgi:hypothetical protein
MSRTEAQVRPGIPALGEATEEMLDTLKTLED